MGAFIRIKIDDPNVLSVHRVWKGMRSRCNDLKNKDYGGRGISVCDRWTDFLKFLSDMGPKPTPKHSIDRINVDGNYEPGNCRWATATQQIHNRRRWHGQPMGDRLGLRGTPELLEKIDGWRRKKDPIPTRSEAIRFLLDSALRK